MTGVKEIAQETYRIQVQVKVPGVYITCTVYFINEGNGVIIDPGPASAIPTIQKTMQILGMKDLSYIIPTHAHVDHAGGSGSLSRLFPRANVVLHPAAKEHLIDPTRLIASTKRTYGDSFEDYLGLILPLRESQVVIPEDGQVISLNGRNLRIIYAPGHAPHHIAILDLKTKGLFCGEALGMRAKSAPTSPFPNAAPPSFDPEIYLKTIEKLRTLRPDMLFYAHDGVERNPEELISKVAESTTLFRDMIVGAFRVGKTIDNVVREIRESVLKPLGIEQELDIRMTVEGFYHYFREKGQT